MNIPALAPFTLAIASGAEADITASMLEGLLITSLTDGASAAVRIGNSEALPIFKGFRTRLRQEVRGARIRNTGGTSLTVSGYYWSGAEIDDLRLILDAATSVLAVKPRVDAPTNIFPRQIRQDPYLYLGAAAVTEVIAAADNVSGVRLCAGFSIFCDPATPGSFAQLLYDSGNPVYFAGCGDAGGHLCLPQSVDIPGGKNVAIRWKGGVSWAGGYTTL